MRFTPSKTTALFLLANGTSINRPAKGRIVVREPVVITTLTMSSLAEHGLVEEKKGGWRITKKGLEAVGASHKTTGAA